MDAGGTVDLAAWAGRVVQVLVGSDKAAWVGFLEGWDDRGVVLRYTEEMAHADEVLGRETLAPLLILFPWSEVRYVSIDLDELE